MLLLLKNNWNTFPVGGTLTVSWSDDKYVTGGVAIAWSQRKTVSTTFAPRWSQDTYAAGATLSVRFSVGPKTRPDDANEGSAGGNPGEHDDEFDPADNLDGILQMLLMLAATEVLDG